MINHKKVEGYTVQLTVLKKNLPKIKKILSKNKKLILRGLLSETKVTMFSERTKKSTRA